MKSYRNGIFHGSVGAVGKLDLVQCAWHAGLDVGHDQPLEALHDDRVSVAGDSVVTHRE